MFEHLKSMVTEGKDKTVSYAIKKIIRFKTEKLGVIIQDFSIDSIHKTMEITVLLHEEDTPLNLKAIDYHITTKNEKHFLEVKEIQKSREWKNPYIDGKRYKIPPEILKVSELIL
ncbi:MAG: hypothetical protein L3J43_01315 [Sulfurovum sp.]|nr:hypothetical protein [Sulfurovum sp.]